jgi:hypothetical protein
MVHHPIAAVHKSSSSWTVHQLAAIVFVISLAIIIIVTVTVISVLRLWPGQKSSSSLSALSSSTGGHAAPAGWQDVAPEINYCGDTTSPRLAVGQLASFEWPILGYGNLQGQVPDTCTQPWYFPLSTSGIAVEGSIYDPQQAPTPPDGFQYAFLQDSADMAVEWNVTQSAQYTVSFWYSTPNINSHNNCTVFMNGVPVWNNPDVNVAAGWVQVTSAPQTMATSVCSVVALCLRGPAAASVIFDSFDVTNV